MTAPLVCTPKSLPRHQLVAAAEMAVAQNPVNAPPVSGLAMFALAAPTRERLAVLTSKYWGAKGVKLTVAFLDSPTPSLKRRLLAHLNAWGAGANVTFTATARVAQVRIARADDGYWSYLGTDIGLIARGEPTMNLQGFTDQTPESEFRRVVRHEAGHTLGFPHEHARRAIVALLDPDKVVVYFRATQGWSDEQIRQQILTPLDESTLLGTVPDTVSIMTYQFPGEVTRNGRPILGGLDINARDRAFVGKVYPRPKKP